MYKYVVFSETPEPWTLAVQIEALLAHHSGLYAAPASKHQNPQDSRCPLRPPFLPPAQSSIAGMMRLSTASILGLAAAATALPTDSMSLTTLASRQDDDPLQDKEKFCHGFKLDTIEHAQELWDQTGSGVILDMWVESWNST